jgi:hypothetical protein
MNIQKDNSLKFCVLFHERFQFLCQMMDKVHANRKLFDPLEALYCVVKKCEYPMVDHALT